MENRISVITPEYVSLKFEVAGIGSRALALLVDWLVLITIGIILVLPAILFFGLADTIGGPLWSSTVIGIFMIVFIFMPTAYYVLMEYYMNGQTLGKKVMGLRVISDRGTAPGLFSLFLRNLLRIVDNMPFAYLVGMTTIFIHNKEKRLGDLAAGTLVVRIDQQAMPHIQYRYNKGEELLTSRELALVTEQQWLLLGDFLSRRDSLEPKKKKEIAIRLTNMLFPENQWDPNKSEFYLETAYHQLGKQLKFAFRVSG